MKIAVDFLSKLDGREDFFRKDLCHALENSGMDVFEIRSPRIKKALDQEIKADCFISFNLKYGGLKVRTAKYFVLADNVIPGRATVKNLKNFDQIIVKTGFKKLQLSNKYGIEKDKIIVVHDKTDECFDLKNISDDERNIRRILTIYRVNKPFIFFYSHLYEGSNVSSLIEAFAQIHHKFPDCKLLLASPEIKVGWDNKPLGQSKRAREIIELVTKYKLQRKIVFAGLIEEKDLPVVIRNAEICVNLKDYEHFPYSLVEQLFAGACIISADNAVSKEILGNAGFAVSSKYADSITQGMKHLMEEKEERDQLRQKAAKRRKFFKPDALYKELIENIERNIQARAKEKVLLLDFGGKVDLGKILKVNFEPVQFDLRKKRSFFQILKDFQKYRVVFIQGGITKAWSAKLVGLKLLSRNIKFISIECLEKNFKTKRKSILAGIRSKFKSLLYRIILEIVFNNKFEFDYQYRGRAEILPAFFDIEEGVGELKLGGFTGISVGPSVRGDDLALLLRETFSNRCKFLVEEVLYRKINSSKNLDSKYKKRVIEAKPAEALNTSKIYINLDNRIEQQKILQAFCTSNLLICLKTPNTINLIQEGINGYLYKEEDIQKIAKQVNVLLENKKHLKDICNINLAKSKQYNSEKLLKEYKIFLNRL
ncbi:glycosyltransferase [Candidatus Dojkabacteria bacterium]|nr:glycosyltransferase [Candidatus Dojkabacteria bacterium]